LKLRQSKTFKLKIESLIAWLKVEELVSIDDTLELWQEVNNSRERLNFESKSIFNLCVGMVKHKRLRALGIFGRVGLSCFLEVGKLRLHLCVFAKPLLEILLKDFLEEKVIP